jgi:hypothetical protein
MDKINIDGGAIAHGHPLGASVREREREREREMLSHLHKQ